MKTKISQNDNFDQLVTGLLKTTALRDDEVETIVSRNELFSSVRARIIADNVDRIENIGTITFFQRTAILTAGAALIVIAVFGTMMVAKRPDRRSVAKTPIAANNDKNSGSLAGVPESVPPTLNVDGPEAKSPLPHFVKAMEYRQVVPERRLSAKPQPQVEEEPPQFYALAGLRPSEAAVDGSRIIRVELPRASLVTLGVNVPLDSDKQLIKTDLLVGPDGVPRAIRLVE